MRSVWFCMENGLEGGGVQDRSQETREEVTARVQLGNEGGWTRVRAEEVERASGILGIPLGISQHAVLGNLLLVSPMGERGIQTSCRLSPCLWFRKQEANNCT